MNRSWRGGLRLVLLGLAFAAGTYAVGWWAVPVIGAAWGLMSPAARRAALLCGVAAAAAWAALLLVPAAVGAPVLSFGAELAVTMRASAWVLAAVELLFPFALAWAAAALGSVAFDRRRAPGAPGPEGNPSRV